MQASEMLEVLQRKVNRPEQDDFFDYPDEFYAALTEAADSLRRRAVHQAEDLFREEYATPLTAQDSTGETYLLPDDHFGEIMLFTPPGPRRGELLPPVNHYPVNRVGYFQNGRTIKLTRPKVYSPGLYLVWIPKNTDPIDQNNDSPLPSYFDYAIIYEAARILAEKPGSLINSAGFKARADAEWRGDPDRLDDTGILGILARQRAYDPQSHVHRYEGAWWRNINP